jgi:hypothetical protein
VLLTNPQQLVSPVLMVTLWLTISVLIPLLVVILNNLVMVPVFNVKMVISFLDLNALLIDIWILDAMYYKDHSIVYFVKVDIVMLMENVYLLIRYLILDYLKLVVLVPLFLRLIQLLKILIVYLQLMNLHNMILINLHLQDLDQPILHQHYFKI